MLKSIIVFLILNFGALALGGLATTGGVSSDWYANLDKAPWTPPGWVFGFAWTTIMICFTIYMAKAWGQIDGLKAFGFLFALQWILNVLWNPIFFKWHLALLGLLVIISLTVVVGIFLFKYWSVMKSWSYLVLPYFLWLLIATSLNAYILIRN